MKGWHALLEIDFLKLIIEEKNYVKYPMPLTCGIFRTGWNCFLSAQLQLFARINQMSWISVNFEIECYPYEIKSNSLYRIDEQILKIWKKSWYIEILHANQCTLLMIISFF